jgi:hypothetical protein
MIFRIKKKLIYIYLSIYKYKMSYSFGTTKETIIDDYHHNYPWKYYKNYPEFAINKLCIKSTSVDNILKMLPENKIKKFINSQYLLNIDKDSLQTLPPLELRNRDIITEWLRDSSITYDDILGVGW